MSYTVGLLIGPVPPGKSTVYEQFNALGQASDFREPPHPTFVAVHRDLTARFPCMSALSDDGADGEVWTDGMLIAAFVAQHAVIGFAFSPVDRMLPFVIEVARRHGVTVFDWQTETIYHP